MCFLLQKNLKDVWQEAMAVVEVEAEPEVLLARNNQHAICV